MFCALPCCKDNFTPVLKELLQGSLRAKVVMISFVHCITSQSAMSSMYLGHIDQHTFGVENRAVIKLSSAGVYTTRA